MAKRLALIPGHCLFTDHSRLEPDENMVFFMAEDKGLCTHFRYHRHKILLFLSSMRSHRDQLRRTYELVYYKIDEQPEKTYAQRLSDELGKGYEELVTYIPEDKFFAEMLDETCQRAGVFLKLVESPAFLFPMTEFTDYLGSVKKPFMHTWYIRQRKKLGLLLDENGEALHGKWSFDEENRKRLPKDIYIPPRPTIERTTHTTDLIPLVDELFADHPGDSATSFHWPTTREDARTVLQDFLVNRFQHFGPYEDAISKEHTFLFHSTLSPLMNTGLLTPAEVLDDTLKYASNKDVHYPSLEGFVRQIIGWREFLRGCYHNLDMQGNFFDHQGKLTDDWYKGTTGIPPVDDAIRKVNRTGYLHHIERLMVVGNIMLLSRIHPDEVYRWFMEMFVDSSDWVMVPNVYGMSQFADGGSFATKPYVAGSNYLLKMSNYEKGKWCDVVDGLYWSFIDQNRAFFQSNPRMSMMVRAFDKLTPARKEHILKAAEEFICNKTIRQAV